MQRELLRAVVQCRGTASGHIRMYLIRVLLHAAPNLSLLRGGIGVILRHLRIDLVYLVQRTLANLDQFRDVLRNIAAHSGLIWTESNIADSISSELSSWPAGAYIIAKSGMSLS